jgi:flagellar hook-length control protein FliK
MQSIGDILAQARISDKNRKHSGKPAQESDLLTQFSDILSEISNQLKTQTKKPNKAVVSQSDFFEEVEVKPIKKETLKQKNQEFKDENPDFDSLGKLNETSAKVDNKLTNNSDKKAAEIFDKKINKEQKAGDKQAVEDSATGSDQEDKIADEADVDSSPENATESGNIIQTEIATEVNDPILVQVATIKSEEVGNSYIENEQMKEAPVADQAVLLETEIPGQNLEIINQEIVLTKDVSTESLAHTQAQVDSNTLPEAVVGQQVIQENLVQEHLSVEPIDSNLELADKLKNAEILEVNTESQPSAFATRTLTDNLSVQNPANDLSNMQQLIKRAKEIVMKQLDSSVINTLQTNSNSAVNSGTTPAQANVNSILNNKVNVEVRELKKSILPRAFASKTMEKVESALKEVSKSKDGKTISVRLDPPSLGSVKIDVSFRDGKLTARVVAESSQVSQFLREKAPEIQQLLRQIGLDADEVNVWVGSQSEFSDSHSKDEQQSAAEQFAFNQNEMFQGQIAKEVKLEANVKPSDLDHWVA